MPKRRQSLPRVRVHKNTRTEVLDGDKRTRNAKDSEAIERELEELLEDIDEVLADIDAAAFVTGYRQKGGE